MTLEGVAFPCPATRLATECLASEVIAGEVGAAPGGAKEHALGDEAVVIQVEKS